MGRYVARWDHPHAKEARPAEGPSADPRRRDGDGIDARVARLVGDGQRVLILGREAEPLARTLEARGCRAVAGPGEPIAVEGGPEPFDAVVLADLLGRIDDPRAALRAVKDQIRPGGRLIVTLTGIAPVGTGGRLAIVDGEPLGAESGLVFTEEGLLGLLESSEYVIGHVERIATATANNAADADVHDCLIVAYPLPMPGLDWLQRRLRDLEQRGRESDREAEGLRRELAQAEQRLEIMAGHERRLAGRVEDLRARLLEAHAEMIRRDDEIRKTFGDAIYLRNALLIERDALIGQRDALLIERDALIGQRDALAAERADLVADRAALFGSYETLLAAHGAVRNSLHDAETRLERLRRSPLGLAFRAVRKLSPRRGGRGDAGTSR